MPSFDTQAIAAGDAKQLAGLFTELAAAVSQTESKIRLLFIADFFTALGPQHHHQLLGEKHALVKGAFESHVGQIEQLATDPQHPLNLALDLWLGLADCWHPNDSRASQGYADKLTSLVDAMVATQSRAAEPWRELASLLAQLADWQGSETRRALLAETRLCEVASGEFRSLAAECAVLDLLNEHLSHRYVPLSLQHGLETTLKNALLHTVLTSGEADHERLPFWQFWQRQLYQLASIYGDSGIALDDQALYEKLPAQLEKLEHSLPAQTVDPQAYGLWIEDLNNCLMATIQKQPIECFQFVPLAYPEGAGQKQVTLTPSLLAQFSQVKLGDWFYFRTEDSQPLTLALRCKLALKHEASGQLLFVDVLGRKVLAKSMQDFALCLSTGIAHPMEPSDVALAWAKVRKGWVKRAKQHIEKAKAQRDTAPHSSQQLADDISIPSTHSLASATPDLTQSRQSAAIKAREEASAFKQQAEQIKAKHTNAERSLGELQVGAWLEVNEQGKEPLRCKLSVIIQSSGKYILVDQLGRKHSEILKAELGRRLANGEIKILHKGNNFEDQLAKVIQGLRRDVS